MLAHHTRFLVRTQYRPPAHKQPLTCDGAEIRGSVDSAACRLRVGCPPTQGDRMTINLDAHAPKFRLPDEKYDARDHGAAGDTTTTTTDPTTDIRSTTKVIADNVTRELDKQGRSRAWLAAQLEATQKELDDVLDCRRPMSVNWLPDFAEALGVAVLTLCDTGPVSDYRFTTACPSWCTLGPGHQVDSIHDDGQASRGHGGPDFGAYLHAGADEYTDAPGVLVYEVQLSTDGDAVNIAHAGSAASPGTECDQSGLVAYGTPGRLAAVGSVPATLRPTGASRRGVVSPFLGRRLASCSRPIRMGLLARLNLVGGRESHPQCFAGDTNWSRRVTPRGRGGRHADAATAYWGHEGGPGLNQVRPGVHLGP